jgi:hypothetical protein
MHRILLMILMALLLGCSKPQVTDKRDIEAAEYYRGYSMDSIVSGSPQQIRRIQYSNDYFRTHTDIWFMEFSKDILANREYRKTDNLPDSEIMINAPNWFPKISSENYLCTISDKHHSSYWFFSGEENDKVYAVYSGID